MASKKTGSKKTPDKAQVRQRPKVRTKVVRSTASPSGDFYKSMSGDPFTSGKNSFPTQVHVDFASELGRRGGEVRGLGAGPIATSVVNAAVARKRSRHAVLTNGYAKRAVDILVSNMVGTGHTLISLAPDKDFKRKVEDLWKKSSKQFDMTGKNDFGGLEALAYRSMVEGGDSFVRFRVRRPEDNLHVPLQLQVFEAEQVPIHKNEVNGKNKVVAGVEFTPFGMPTRYHMFRNHPGDYNFSIDAMANMQTVPVDASEIIHLHDVRRPGEVRGLPVLSSALIQLSDFDRYMDAELVRKKAAALIGGFITQTIDALGPNPFITEEGEDDDENDDVQIEQLEPGTFPILPAGYDVRFSDPADVGANFNDFIKQQLLSIAASVNITYEQLSGDLKGANDRTIRASMLEFKRIARHIQETVLVHQFCQRVFDRWFDMALLSGALTIPPGMTEEEARSIKWIADPWEYLNPLQELNTQVKEVRAGFRSRSEIIIQRGGVPEEVDQKIIEDKQREKDNDLIFDTNVEVVSAAGVVQSTDPSLNLAEEDEDKEPSGNNNPQNEDEERDENA